MQGSGLIVEDSVCNVCCPAALAVLSCTSTLYWITKLGELLEYKCVEPLFELLEVSLYLGLLCAKSFVRLSS